MVQGLSPFWGAPASQGEGLWGAQRGLVSLQAPGRPRQATKPLSKNQCEGFTAGTPSVSVPAGGWEGFPGRVLRAPLPLPVSFKPPRSPPRAGLPHASMQQRDRGKKAAVGGREEPETPESKAPVSFYTPGMALPGCCRWLPIACADLSPPPG